MTRDRTLGQPNPWLAIPVEDCEGHMASPEVGQAAFQAETLGATLMTLVAPEDFASHTEDYDLTRIGDRTATLPSGKAFYVGTIRKPG